MIESIAIVIVLVFGIAISAVCLFSLAVPSRLIDTVIRIWRRPGGMAMAVGVRLLLGAGLLIAAEHSRAPEVFTAFGVFTVLAAIAIPLIGHQRIENFMRWWARQGPWMVRGWLVSGLAMGLFFVWGSL